MNKDSSSNNCRALFIGGFPSGGTDLLKSVLNAHPDIYINGEMPFLYRLLKAGYDKDTMLRTEKDVDKFRRYLIKLDPWNNIENINAEIDGNKLFQTGIKIEDLLRYWFNNKNTLFWGNKTPQNTEHLRELNGIIRKPYFLIIVRDIRDICLSWKKKWGKNIYLCAHKWNMRMKSIDELNLDGEKDRFLLIKYEDLLTNTLSVTQQIAAFLKIDWSENMIEHHKYVEVIIDGKRNYGKKINPYNLRKWEKSFSKRKVKRIEQIAYNSLKTFKYKLSYARKSSPLSKLLIALYNLHDLYAIIFRGNIYDKNNTLINRLGEVKYEIKKYVFRFLRT